MLNFVGRQRVCYYINKKAGTLPIPASDLERKTRLELATLIPEKRAFQGVREPPDCKNPVYNRILGGGSEFATT